MTFEEIEEIRTLIEKDLLWRNEEMSFLESLLNHITERNREETEKRQSIYRKNLVMALYSHFEGFFRYSFETYAYTINDLKIETNKAIHVLKASSLNKDFLRYEDSNKWVTSEDEFAKAHKRIANRVLLLENIHNNSTNHLELPISSNHLEKHSVIYTESNLTPSVIDKILYGLGVHQKLGLTNVNFMKLMGLISSFVKKRNGIAHGDNKAEFKDGISLGEYNKFKRSYTEITTLVGPIITKSLNDKLYLKPEYR